MLSEKMVWQVFRDTQNLSSNEGNCTEYEFHQSTSSFLALQKSLLSLLLSRSKV